MPKKESQKKDKKVKNLRQRDCQPGVVIKGHREIQRIEHLRIVTARDSSGNDLIPITGKGTDVVVYDSFSGYEDAAWNRPAESTIRRLMNPNAPKKRHWGWRHTTPSKEDIFGTCKMVVPEEIEILAVEPSVTFYAAEKGTKETESGGLFVLGKHVKDGSYAVVFAEAIPKMILSNSQDRLDDLTDEEILSDPDVSILTELIDRIDLGTLRAKISLAIGARRSRKNQERFDYLTSKVGTMAILGDNSARHENPEDVIWHVRRGWTSHNSEGSGPVQILEVRKVVAAQGGTPSRTTVNPVSMEFKVRPIPRKGDVLGCIVKVMSGKTGILWVADFPGSHAISIAS